MNKYQEAYKRMEFVINGFTRHTAMELHKDIQPIKELVEKTTPKKVRRALHIANGYKHCCPICSSYVGTISKVGRIDEDDYCPTCGQALDWSGEDE